MKFWFRLLLALWVVAMTAALPGSYSKGLASPASQDDLAAQKARALLASMTPEEKVGQLFLVTFNGTTFDDNSQIFDLIANNHIGGVVLSRSKDNFSISDNVLGQTYALTRLLQDSAYKASQISFATPTTGTSSRAPYIPLLIGTSQEGDNYPNDQILNGLTALPDLMAIGATWDTTLAQKVGSVMGSELSALGFNLYLGPSLDVLDPKQTESGQDLGPTSFGESPYWVSKMGQAYISGLHQGSSNRLLVIAKNFPGRGSADRSPDVEIATVRKSLDQLKANELVPFYAVTGNAPDASMRTDGLLVSHIRYQGIQGAIRSTTRPISSDSAALDQLLKLTPLSQWRDGGGVLISDNLGSPAIRKFYDPTGNAFDARTVAREAFFAGNDLLYVDNFIATGDPDMYTTLQRTLTYFAQKYRDDPVFAQRVDSSAQRILTLKYHLYPEFSLDRVVPEVSQLASVGTSQQVTFDTGRRAVTLISPDSSDITNLLPRGPEARERIVFLTDVQTGKQCTGCLEQPALAADALQSTVMRLYGPRAGGQVSQNLLTSYSFLDLWKDLNGTATGASATETPAVENDLKLADWVVVSMLKPNASQPESQAFRRLLSDRPELLRNKKVIVFAFGAPYYLDATDISKLTAYYALYSKTAPFVEVAARILFQDVQPNGALPVSVSGIGYSLPDAIKPDPSQIIQLFPDNPGAVNQPTSTTQEPTPEPLYQLGDVISVRTGVIFDHNRHPVPDGTQVRFDFSVISETSGSTVTLYNTDTVDGIARASWRIDRTGHLEISAASDPDTLSNLLRLDISTGVRSRVTLVAATPQPTGTPEPTATITPTLTPTVTPTPAPLPAKVEFKDWFFVLALILTGAAGVSWLGVRQAIARWGLRLALCGVIGGMIAYNYLALKLPGSQVILDESGTVGVLLVTLGGVIFGWGAGLIWRQLTNSRARQTGERASGKHSVTGPKSQSN